MDWLKLGRWLNASSHAFVLGVLVAGAYFAVLSLPALANSELRRYSMSHTVEQFAIFMCCWALADMLLKKLAHRRQRAALDYAWLPVPDGKAPPSTAHDLHAIVSAARPRMLHTWLGLRLLGGLHYVRSRQSAEGLDEHLRHLSDLDAERAHAGFALVRVIAWMIPILGFLGTVVGITIAVANVSPNQLDTSLTEVTGGLAMAFDATAVALTLAMGLMFTYFLVERSEQALLHQVEVRVGHELQHRFAAGDPTSAPHLEAIRAASTIVIEHTQKLVKQQVDLWNEALTALMQQSATVQRQQEATFQALLGALGAEGQQQLTALHQSAEQLERVEERLHDTAGVLAEILDGETKLLPMQQSLAENIRVLRETQSLDEALHSLTAAIHLLTARNRLGVVGDRAA